MYWKAEADDFVPGYFFTDSDCSEGMEGPFISASSDCYYMGAYNSMYVLCDGS